MCDRQRLSLTGGLEGLGQRPVEDPDRRAQAEGLRALARRQRRRGARSPTTGPGCYRGWPSKPSSCAPRSSSAPSPTTSIAAACAGPGFGAARTCTSDTCSTSPATQPIVADAPTHRRRHPARGRGGRIWRYFRAAHAHRGHAGRTGGLAKRPDGFRRRIPHLGVRAGKSHLINGLLRVAPGGPPAASKTLRVTVPAPPTGAMRPALCCAALSALASRAAMAIS